MHKNISISYMSAAHSALTLSFRLAGAALECSDCERSKYGFLVPCRGRQILGMQVPIKQGSTGL